MAWRYGLKRQMWGNTVEGYKVIEVFDFDRPAIQRAWSETEVYADTAEDIIETLNRMEHDITSANNQPDVVEDLERKLWWWSDAPNKLYPSEEV